MGGSCTALRSMGRPFGDQIFASINQLVITQAGCDLLPMVCIRKCKQSA